MSVAKRPGEGQARVDTGPVPRAKGARDVHDKAFQREAKQHIITFLADTRYQAQISMKRLNELSQKDFLGIFNWVLRLLVPGAKEAAPSADGVQYVVDTLKCLGYPAVPAKSILSSISTPSSVATATGILRWLVARAEAEVYHRPSRADATTLMNEPYVPELVQGLLATWAGDADGRHFDQLVEDGAQRAQREGEDERHRIAEEIEVCMRKRAEYESLGDLALPEIEAREAAQRQLDGMRADTKHFTVAVPEMQRTQAKLEAQREQAQAVIAAVEREIGELRAAVEAQPMTRATADGLAAETERKRVRLKGVQEERAAKQEEIAAVAAALQEHRTALQRDTSAMNTALAALKLAPATARHAHAADLRVDVNPSPSDVEHILQGPAKGALQAALTERVAVVRRGRDVTQERLTDTRARKDSAAEMARQLQARLPGVQTQRAQLEASLAAERDTIDAETSELLAGVASAEARMAAAAAQERQRREMLDSDRPNVLATSAEVRAACDAELAAALAAAGAAARACTADGEALEAASRHALQRAAEFQDMRAKTLQRARDIIVQFNQAPHL